MKSILETLLDESARLTNASKLLSPSAAMKRALDLGAEQLRQWPYPQSPQASAASSITAPSDADAALDPGPAMVEGAYSGRSGRRDYKLFIPPRPARSPAPALVVMLHGCKQDPEDFAQGTRMNELAREQGFLALYPAQAPRSNSSKCWNWFQPRDQRRGEGEPDLLASMTQEIIALHGVDPQRVYVAGLSAGASMAIILGREYPDLFAAVGAHSGVPHGAATDVSSAFSQMRTASSTPHGLGSWPSAQTSEPEPAPALLGAPMIVFHGDADATVHPGNSEQIIQACLGAEPGAREELTIEEQGKAIATRVIHWAQGEAPSSPSRAEHWTLHGLGHAWSGGSSEGSYTAPSGVDASREMLRFFNEHPSCSRSSSSSC